MKKIVKWALGAVAICSIGVNGSKHVKNVEDMEKAGIVYEQIVKEESVSVSQNFDNVDLKTSAKSAYLMDFGTQTVMYSHNETQRLPIASMCKIMTLLLSFDAIEEGALTMDEEICVSERAASMGGSQVFLEANGKYTVRNLIKSVVVCSANDSCVALAERIAGNESLFVDQMNEKAKKIGATDTLFANCTGLPKEPQYSCAKDVAIMMKNLLNHEEYYQFSNVWMDKFAHPEGRFTEITNTNKLVRFYDGCDGGKTGFTNEAGFCLAATAKRQDLRVISVVIGGATSSNRFEDVKTMFDYAFANYSNESIAEEGVALDCKVNVLGGKEKTVSVCPSRTVYALKKRGAEKNVTTELFFDKVKAPVEKGQKVGEIVLYKDGVETDRVELIAMDAVRKANILDYIQEIARKWNG